MDNFFNNYKYLIVPFCVWLTLQILKVLLYKHTNKEWNWHRITGAGGLISSHSAVVTTIATMIGKNVGMKTPLFALSVIFAFIVMYDAAGIRRSVGEHAKILNTMINEDNKKLQEMTGHTPIQVFLGFLVGFLAGTIFG